MAIMMLIDNCGVLCQAVQQNFATRLGSGLPNKICMFISRFTMSRFSGILYKILAVFVSYDQHLSIRARVLGIG